MINNIDYDKSLYLILKGSDKVDLILEFLNNIPIEVKDIINSACISNDKKKTYQNGIIKTTFATYEYYVFDNVLHIAIYNKSDEKKSRVIELTINKFIPENINNNYYIPLGKILICDDYYLTNFSSEYIYSIKNERYSDNLYSIREEYIFEDYNDVKTYSVFKEDNSYRKIRKKK